MSFSSSLVVFLALVTVTYAIDTQTCWSGSPANVPQVFDDVSTAPSQTQAGVTSPYNDEDMVSVFTDSDTIKIYVRADPTSYTTTNTYDVSYTLKEDDVTSSEVTLGTFSSTDIPVIVLSDLTEANYTLKVYTTENSSPTSKETTPLTIDFTVIAGPVDTEIYSTVADYYNAYTGTIKFRSNYFSKTNHATTQFRCSIEAVGEDDDYFDCGSASNAADSGSYDFDLTGKSDGTYVFKVFAQYVGDSNRADIGTMNDTVSAESVFVLDTTDPTITVSKYPDRIQSPGAKVRFEFSCSDENNACTVYCSLDGEAKKSASKTASKGFLACKSPYHITLKDDGTSAFVLYSKDTAGNSSPYTRPYQFYTDKTAPAVVFKAVDETQEIASDVEYNADQGYYATAIKGSETQYLIDGVTKISETSGGSTSFSPIDDDGDSSGTACNNGGCTDDADDIGKTNDLYNTVVQVPLDIQKEVYSLNSDEYGAILGAQTVNGKTYYNVLMTTNAPEATLNFECSHSEIQNCDTANGMTCP